jgi:peptidoglycan hydrolase-like protein with peptidoglycan-binding domain
MARAKKKRKMTAATLSRLPFTAGGTLVGSMGHGVLWAMARLLRLGALAYGQFMRAPLAISVGVAVAGFSILAGSNALYFQPERHPAPLFFSPVKHAVRPPAIRPVVPAPRPHLPVQPAVDEATTGSLGPDSAPDQIDTADVKAMQQKLRALNLLDDEADGIFGRRTAAALRAFEAKFGMKPDGRLTPRIIAAVAAAPLPSVAEPLPAQPVPAALAAAAPAPTLETAVAAPAGQHPRPVPLAPLPTSAPKAAAQAPETAPKAAPQMAAVTPEPAPPAANTFAANSLAPDTAGSTMASADEKAPSAPEPAGDESAAGGSAAAMTAAPAAPAAPDDGRMTPAQRLAAQMGTLPPEATADNAVPPATVVPDETNGSTDPALITKIQRGLASLGFLGAKIDGVPGEGTAKAIRNFEVFYDYKVTGLATHQLLNLLRQHGAVI